MNRRAFIASLALLGVSGKVLASLAEQPDLFFSAQGAQKNQFGFASVDGQVHEGLTAFRGHGATQHPIDLHRVVMFARRPGHLGVEIDLRTGLIVNRFNAQPNQHFFGHGCFSADGRWLYTTEMDLTSNKGLVGIRDGRTFEWLGSFATQGIGPHDIHLMSDGETLVVANGGILTRPETGRKRLNLETMQPSLVYLNRRTGALLEQHTLAESKASIRHLGVDKDGVVAVAMQVQREALPHQHPLALAAIHRRGQPMQLLKAPDNIWLAFDDYIGSVALNHAHKTVGFSSPRGNLVGFWNYETGQFKDYYRLNDVCGLTTSLNEDRFILSNSFGSVRYLNAQNLQEDKHKRQKYTHIAWDNHLLKLKPYRT